MQVIVVDLQSDMGKALKSVKCALATAKATERRAWRLVDLAKASPEILRKAWDIRQRATVRVSKLERVLRLATDRLAGERLL